MRELDHDRIVETCVEVRGVKVSVSKIDIPVPVAAAFEGETVRRDDMQVQFGGKYTHRVRVPADEVAGPGGGREDRADRGRLRRGGHGRRDAAGLPDRGGGPEDAGGLRADPGAADPHLREPRHGCVPHGAAGHELGPHLEGRVQGGAAAEALWRTAAGRVSAAVPGAGGQGAGDDPHRRIEDGAGAGAGARGLEAPRRPSGGHDRRERGYVLLLHALPVVRAEPRVHHQPGAAGAVRGLQLAGWPRRLRDQPGGGEPTGAQGPGDRRAEGAVGGRQRVRERHLEQERGAVQRLLADGRPDDLVRMLRVHHGDPARPVGDGATV